MKVLVACEFSGTVRDAFAQLGHEAWSCDLLPTIKPGNHFQCDVREVLSRGWDLMVAHPECTYLTNSAEWAYGPGPYHQKIKPGTLVGQARVKAREQAINFFRELLEANIPQICIENPIGCISSRIRKPDQTIQPHQFGEDASKATCLWLKSLSFLRPTNNFLPRLVTPWVQCECCEDYICTIHRKHVADCTCKPIDEWGDRNPYFPCIPRWGNQTDSGQNRLSPGEDRWKIRSITYQGIANAMALQWTLDDL